MKKNLIICLMVIFTTAVNGFDLYGVYDRHAPQGCIEADLRGPISLPDLMQIAICNNPALSAEYMLLKSKEAALGSSKGQYLPSVTLVGQGTLQENKVEHVSGVKKAEPYSATASAQWLIYDFGGRSSQVGQNKALLSATNYSYNAALQELILKVNNAYLNTLSAKASLESYKESNKTYQRAYQESKKRYDLGMVTLVDKLQAKTSYEQSQLQVVKAENSLHQAQGNLATLLNLNPSTEIKLLEIKDDGNITKLEKDDEIENLMTEALKERPELKAGESSVLASKESISYARTGALPSLSAIANGSYGDNWKHSSPYELNGEVGLKLSWPLFSGMSTMYQIDQAKFLYEQSRKNLDNQRNSVLNEVWSYYQNYQTGVKAYEISKQILATAEENSKVAFRYYEVGKVDILNLLNANSKLADAKQGVVNAFYGLLINKAQLYRAVGRLNNDKTENDGKNI